MRAYVETLKLLGAATELMEQQKDTLAIAVIAQAMDLIESRMNGRISGLGGEDGAPRGSH